MKQYMFIILGILLFLGCINLSGEKSNQEQDKNEFFDLLSKYDETVDGDFKIVKEITFEADYDLGVTLAIITIAKKGDLYKFESNTDDGWDDLTILADNHNYNCFNEHCLDMGDSNSYDEEQILKVVSAPAKSPGVFGVYDPSFVVPKLTEYVDYNKIYKITKTGEKTFAGRKCTEFQVVFDEEYITSALESNKLANDFYKEAVSNAVSEFDPWLECIDKETGIVLYWDITFNFKYLEESETIHTVSKVKEFSTIVSDSEFELPYAIK